MQQPFISICIPAYKNTAFLERLLHSIAEQSYRNYEVILTDDSPDNNIEQLAETYSKRLPLSYFKNTPAAGIPQNWNECIAKANGEWIKLMHDDDWFTGAESLQLFATAAMKYPACSFIFSACNNVDLQSNKSETQHLTGWRSKVLDEAPENLIYHNVIGHPSVIMHRKTSLQYDPGFKWLVDIDFYLLYLKQHPQWHYIEQPCVNIGINSSQLSSQYYKNPAVEIPEYFSFVSKHKLELSSRYVFYAFWLLVKKFQIKNLAQIQLAGYQYPIPDGLKTIIACQKKIPRLILKQTPFSDYFMKRCYRQNFPS